VARGSDARRKLLDAAIEHIAANGISDLSLRELAAAIGTSHRMLIHHFGSKERLWVEVIRAVEDRQREVLAEIVPDPAQPPADALRAWWRHISDPALWPNERLFFEVYAQALQGSPHAQPLLDGIVDLWVEPLARIAVARGEDETRARAEARLGIAVTRGLLLDLLATRDRAAVDAAMERYIEALAPDG
jgi:AcrR family transcriptional regulator